MTTEKICFRYDGSDEAKKAYEVWNSMIPLLYPIKPYIGRYYQSNGDCDTTYDDHSYCPPNYRLVTPAEFLRLVKGEPEWTPKCGEEVEVSDNLINWHKYTYIGKNPHNSALPYVIANVEGTIMPYKHIRPVRKSVREEIDAIVKDWLLSENHYDLADRILDIIKERKDEL